MIKRDRFDDAFSTLVRARAGWRCERCGTQYEPHHARGLHCSHLVGRGNHTTRWNPLAAAAHCHGCHLYLTSHPEEFAAWIRQHLCRCPNAPEYHKTGCQWVFLQKLKQPKYARKWRKAEKERLWLEMKDELFRLRQCEATGTDFMHFSLPEAERIVLQFDEGGV